LGPIISCYFLLILVIICDFSCRMLYPCRVLYAILVMFVLIKPIICCSQEGKAMGSGRPTHNPVFSGAGDDSVV